MVLKAATRATGFALLTVAASACGHSPPRTTAAAYVIHVPGIVTVVQWKQTGATLVGSVSTSKIRKTRPATMTTVVGSLSGRADGNRVTLHIGRKARAAAVVGTIHGGGRKLTLSTRESQHEAITLTASTLEGCQVARERLRRAGARARVDSKQLDSPAKRVSADYLVALGNQLDRSIFWVGPRRNRTLELTRIRKGTRTFVRYLPANVPAGDDRKYAFVGTYDVRHPVRALRNLAAAQRKHIYRAPFGGIAVVRTPTNVYVAFPGSEVELEIFSPSPELALKLVDRITPIDIEPAPTTGTATPSAESTKT